MTLGIQKCRLRPVPRRVPERVCAVFPTSRSVFFLQVLGTGTRRTSRRLGWNSENGRRLLVFSFFFGEPALVLDRSYDLAAQALGAGLSERRWTCRRAVDLEPIYLHQA